MKFCKILIINVLIISIAGCSFDNTKPSIEAVRDELTVLRFEQDLFKTDFSVMSDSVAFFSKKYGEFFDLFNYKIIKIGSKSSLAYQPLVTGFLTDYSINKVKESVDSVFSDFSAIENGLRTMFRYFKYYFPEQKVPHVVTYISGFNQSIVTTDTILGIGLDKYLGASSQFYAKLGLPFYMRNKMEPSRIIADCAAAWCVTQFPMADSGSNLLSNIIYKGKVAYFTKMLVPDCHDSLVMAMSADQLEWCLANEKQMWVYLVENKMIFKTDFLTIKKFTDDAPFTKDFGRTSPGRAVAWCGYQIVKSYMRQQENTTLKSMMEEDDFQKILRISKYRP